MPYMNMGNNNGQDFVLTEYSISSNQHVRYYETKAMPFPPGVPGRPSYTAGPGGPGKPLDPGVPSEPGIPGAPFLPPLAGAPGIPASPFGPGYPADSSILFKVFRNYYLSLLCLSAG